MSVSTRKPLLFWLCAASLALSFNACDNLADTGPGTGEDPAALELQDVPLNSLALKHGSDCTTVRDYIVNAFIEQTLSQSYGYRMEDVGIAEDAVADSAGGGSANADPDGVSTTNTQESGVDEADMVKTASDGTMYILRGNQLSTIDAFPAQSMARTSTLELTANDPNTFSWSHGLYFDESSQQIVALQSAYGLSPQTLWSSLSSLDATHPAITTQIRLEGELLSSRRVGNRVHMVLGQPSTLYDMLTEEQWGEYYERAGRAAGANGTLSKSEKNELRAYLSAALQNVTAQDVLPSWVDADGQQAQLVACEDVYYPEVSVRPALMTIVSADLDGRNVHATSVMNYGWLTYASPEHLYVVQNGFDWWWDGASSTQGVIYTFTIGEQAPAYIGHAVMSGYVYSPFALSEYAGHLRVAHTLPAQFTGAEMDADTAVSADDAVSMPPTVSATPEGTNRLTVFAVPADASSPVSFEVAGAIKSFAEGEQIYAVRYLGDKAYVVTFLTIDPLFAIDLHDPKNPTITGQLEIPGFSTYIHPIDASTLLTLGYGGTSEGLITELELKLFDVSDAANPVQLQTFPLATTGSYAYSSAEYDHHAFTYYAPRNLFVLPVVTWSETAPFAGLVAVTASREAGFTLVGRINQKDLAYDMICGPDAEAPVDTQYMCQYGDYLWAAAPQRSVVMTSGNTTYLYSISDLGIKSVDTAFPGTTLDTLALGAYDDAWWYYGYAQ